MILDCTARPNTAVSQTRTVWTPLTQALVDCCCAIGVSRTFSYLALVSALEYIVVSAIVLIHVSLYWRHFDLSYFPCFVPGINYYWSGAGPVIRPNSSRSQYHKSIKHHLPPRTKNCSVRSVTRGTRQGAARAVSGAFRLVDTSTVLLYSTINIISSCCMHTSKHRDAMTPTHSDDSVRPSIKIRQVACGHALKVRKDCRSALERVHATVRAENRRGVLSVLNDPCDDFYYLQAGYLFSPRNERAGGCWWQSPTWR